MEIIIANSSDDIGRETFTVTLGEGKTLRDEIEGAAPGILDWSNTKLFYYAYIDSFGTNHFSHVGNYFGDKFNNNSSYPTGTFVFRGTTLVGGSAGSQSMYGNEYTDLIASFRNTITLSSETAEAGIPLPFTAKGFTTRAGVISGDTFTPYPSPAEGDEETLPSKWSVTDSGGNEISSGGFTESGGVHSAKAYVNSEGSFSLKVTFGTQTFSGGVWTNTGRETTETIGFSSSLSGKTITPVNVGFASEQNVCRDFLNGAAQSEGPMPFKDLLAKSSKKYRLVVMFKMNCTHCANLMSAINTHPALFRNVDDLDIVLHGALGENDTDYITEACSGRDWNGWDNVVFSRETVNAPDSAPVFRDYHEACKADNYTPLAFVLKDGVISGFATGEIDSTGDNIAQKWAGFIDSLRAKDSGGSDVNYSGFVEGSTDRTWSGNGDVSVTIALPQSMFEGSSASIGGQALSQADYSLVESAGGSTVFTLKESALRQLSPGTHEVRIALKDGGILLLLTVGNQSDDQSPSPETSTEPISYEISKSFIESATPLIRGGSSAVLSVSGSAAYNPAYGVMLMRDSKGMQAAVVRPRLLITDELGIDTEILLNEPGVSVTYGKSGETVISVPGSMLPTGMIKIALAADRSNGGGAIRTQQTSVVVVRESGQQSSGGSGGGSGCSAGSAGMLAILAILGIVKAKR